MRILLDMDEVLVDFVGGACEAWGVDKEKLTAAWDPKIWDMIDPLSKLLGRSERMGEREFWSKIVTNERFWYELQETPWAYRLFDHIRQTTNDWWIVTSPSECPGCIPGKAAWLKKNFGAEAAERMVPTRHKKLLAKPGVLLIDDRESTVKAFREEGGSAILWPHYGNSSAPFVDVAFTRVTHLLRGYKSCT